MQIIEAADVRAHLSMAECIEAMVEAMIAVSSATASMPPRTIMPLLDKSGYLGVMPGCLSKPSVYGAKIVSLHPANPAAGRPAIQGFVALFDHATGRPVALVDGAEITALRTAAASGLATRLLARPDSSTLGLLGCGAQADAHLEAICTVRDIEEIRIWGRSWQRARAFAQRHSARFKVVAVREPEAAAACDIVCAVTSSAEPIIRGEWMRPGTHVNLVGAHSPTTRESDTTLIKQARVYVDALESALREAGDILIPIEEGAIAGSHLVGEIGALLLGQVEGRMTAEEITVYKSLGLVAQDLIAARAVWLKVSRA